MNKDMQETIRRYAVITVGGAVYSWVFDAFYAPHALTYGGVTGLSQIINFYLPFLPVGAMVMAMNLPLYAVGFWKFGFAFLFRSLYAMVLTSVLIDLFPLLCTFPTVSPLIASLCGGALMGVTMGLLYREETTAGGTELAAWIVRERSGKLSLGRICLIVDLVIIILYAAVFRSFLNAVYGCIALYIATTVIDVVVAVGRSPSPAGQ